MRYRIHIHARGGEQMQRFVRYEGGQIGISGELQAATDWYRKHMGLTFAWDSPAERMASLMTPGNLEGNRLTATAEPAADVAEQFPEARFLRYAPVRIGVRDLDAAIAWYGEQMGLTVLAERKAEGCALMDLGYDCPVWLERLPAEAFTGKQDGTLRPYFMTADIDEAHQYCTEQGLAPTEIDGTPNALQFFWFYDPDCNRLNIWSYPHARAQYAEQHRKRGVERQVWVR